MGDPKWPVQESADASGQSEVRGITFERAKALLRDAFETAQQGVQTAGHPNFRELRTQFEASEGIDQGRLAEEFFSETIGNNISNTRSAYLVYGALKGTPFAGVFKTLEDRRLKEAGYDGGFNL